MQWDIVNLLCAQVSNQNPFIVLLWPAENTKTINSSISIYLTNFNNLRWIQTDWTELSRRINIYGQYFIAKQIVLNNQTTWNTFD